MNVSEEYEKCEMNVNEKYEIIEKYKTELPKIMIDFLNHCASPSQMKSEHTIKNYALDLKKWFNYQFTGDLSITEEDIAEIELIDLDRFIGTLNGKSANTVLRYIASIKSFYKYLVRYYKAINNNIAENIESPKKPTRHPKFLSVKEIVKLINSVDKMNVRQPERDKAIITVFLATGLRLSELTNLKTTDIKDGTIRVIGKGNKERYIPLADKAQSAITEYVKVKSNYDGDFLFITERNTKFNPIAMTNLVKKYLKKAKLDEYSTHKLRHTAASLWYNNGTDIKEIQDLLGHASINTTEIYVHSNKDKRDIVNNIEW